MSASLDPAVSMIVPAEDAFEVSRFAKPFLKKSSRCMVDSHFRRALETEKVLKDHIIL